MLKPQLPISGLSSTPWQAVTLSLRSGFGFFFVYYPAFRRCRGFMLGYWLPPTPYVGAPIKFQGYPGFRRIAAPPGAIGYHPLKRVPNSARLRLAKVNCEFEKSAQMSHLCRFHPFSVQTCWGGCLPPLSPPTTERVSRSLLWIPLCGTAFD